MKQNYATKRVPLSFSNFTGGLNSASGQLNVSDAESSSLQNIDFDKFGSIFSRNGYTVLNSTAITNTPNSDGLYWFNFGSSPIRYAINVADGKLFKMDSLDGTWDDITGAVTITPDNLCDFETYLDNLLVTNNTDLPFRWAGTGNAVAMTVPANLTRAKCVKSFQNYTILANVTVLATDYTSRFYWSTIKTIDTWDAADYIDVNPNDGQAITRILVLGDRLIIYKTNSIYIALFTGDTNLPFNVYKTNSSVGCVAPFSIQEVDNGHVFLSYDGLYFFDGLNSYKISDKIGDVITGLNRNKLTHCTSMFQRDKDTYWLGCASSSSATNDTVITWNITLTAFSKYKGINASSMSIFLVNGVQEQPYFADYGGYTYRADNGDDDYPAKVQTAIDSYYYTNWKHMDDLVDIKASPQAYVYYQISDSILTFSYSFDFDDANAYNISINLATSGSLWDAFLWDVDSWGSSGGKIERVDLTGRGRLIRIGLRNNNLGEKFQIDGLGLLTGLETQA